MEEVSDKVDALTKWGVEPQNLEDFYEHLHSKLLRPNFANAIYAEAIDITYQYCQMDVSGNPHGNFLLVVRSLDVLIAEHQMHAPSDTHNLFQILLSWTIEEKSRIKMERERPADMNEVKDCFGDLARYSFHEDEARALLADMRDFFGTERGEKLFKRAAQILCLHAGLEEAKSVYDRMLSIEIFNQVTRCVRKKIYGSATNLRKAYKRCVTDFNKQEEQLRYAQRTMGWRPQPVRNEQRTHG